MNLVYSLLIITSIGVSSDSLNPKKESDRWLSEDKFHHYINSAALTSSAYLLTNQGAGMGRNKSIYISVSLGTIAGLGKEVYDLKFKNESFSVKDLIYDCLGILTGIMLVNMGGF